MPTINSSYKQIIQGLNEARKALKKETKSLAPQNTKKTGSQVLRDHPQFASISTKKKELNNKIELLTSYYKNHKLRYIIDRIRFIFRSSPLSKARQELNRIQIIHQNTLVNQPKTNRITHPPQNNTQPNHPPQPATPQQATQPATAQPSASLPPTDRSPLSQTHEPIPSTHDSTDSSPHLSAKEMDDLLHLFTSEEEEAVRGYIEDALKENIEESQLSANLKRLKNRLGDNHLLLNADPTANQDFFRDLFIGSPGTIDHYLDENFLISHSFPDAIKEKPTDGDIDSSDELIEDHEPSTSSREETDELNEEDAKQLDAEKDLEIKAFKTVDHYLQKLTFIKDSQQKHEIAKELSELSIASEEFNQFHINADRLNEYLASNPHLEVNVENFKASMYLDEKEFEDKLGIIAQRSTIASAFRNWWQGRR
ncbi:MAG: hypothetical protein ACSNEK_07435 [Parachlamydiaceae bacterium]